MSSVQMEGGDAIPWQEEHTYNTSVHAQRGLQYFVCVSVCLFSHYTRRVAHEQYEQFHCYTGMINKMVIFVISTAFT